MNMSKFWLSLVALMGLGVAACSNVPPGHEGVIVSKTGDGVQEVEVGEGWHFIPPTQDLIVYSLREQTVEWARPSQDERAQDRRAIDDSFNLQDTEGMELGVDIGFRFMVTPGASSDLVQRFGGELNTIVEGRVRNMIRDGLNNAVSVRTAEEVYGEGRREVLEAVEAEIFPQLEALGLRDMDIYWVSQVRLPDTVRGSIDRKIQAEQEALRRENEIAVAEANAQIAIAEAQGEAESRLLRARSEAEALRIQGEALRENPDIITLNAIEAWRDTGGNIPHILVVGDGGALPILDLNDQSSN